MENKNKLTSKRVQWLLIIMLFIVAILAIVLLQRKNSNDDNNIPARNITIINNTTKDENITENNNQTTNSNLNENTNANNTTNIGEAKRLKKVTDTYTYLLIKQCMKVYYSAGKIEMLDLLDSEVKQDLGLNQDTVTASLNIKPIASQFCIDEIYKQNIDENKDIYVIYYRVQTDENNAVQKEMFFKINKQSKHFLVCPEEYLKIHNYLNLKENDIVSISNIEILEENDNNIFYTELISQNDYRYTIELFERYKFDLSYDINHLYNMLYSEYKDIRFKTLEEFNQYINENKEELINDEIDDFEINSYNGIIENVVIGSSNRRYVFFSLNIMEFNMTLDNYTAVSTQYMKIYGSFFPSVQTKYCIERVRKALNEKNYEYIYSKLNPVQKGNYYSNFEDFKKYLSSHFYDQNEFEFKECTVISPKVYQYRVIVTNTKIKTSLRTLTATVTLKKNADFEISIKMS